MESAGPPRDATEQLGNHRDATRVRRFVLHCTDGIDLGLVYTSRDDHAIIGTHESAQVVLQDPSISRFHCEITLVDGRPLIRDLGSMNGTQVGGLAVREAWLTHGVVIGVGRTQLRFELVDGHVEVPMSRREAFGEAVGRSLVMRRLFALLERAATTESTVLLEGETGTGKEITAEGIHRESSRRDGPFVVVDCGSIPGNLIESELFGHERGAFTGAVASRDGAFAAAHGGTLFLDEIGELGADLQPRLLRALERREIKRVGATAYQPVDVRVIAATHRNLRLAVNDRSFRSDLYYRLAVIEVRLPALRERLDDLPLLVETILASFGAASRPEAASIRTPDFLARLARYSWPGNVRELRNHLERCIALDIEAPLLATATSATLTGHDLVDPTLPIRAARDRWTAVLEHHYLRQLLEAHRDNVSAAARAAGLDRVHFHRLLRRYGLR